MADRGVLLAAHDRDAVAPDAQLEALDAVQEYGRLREPIVKHAALCIVKLVFVGPASQLLAQIKILDVGLLQRLLQLFPIEMRDILGIRGRTYIGQHLNIVLFHQGDKRFQRMVRVSHREKIRLLRGIDRIHAWSPKDPVAYDFNRVPS
jgi:hypothetical protein